MGKTTQLQNPRFWNKYDKKKETKLLDVEYPLTKQPDYYTLSQIITIETDNEIDFIILGDHNSTSIVGYVGKREGKFVFIPENDSQREYAPVETYPEIMVNVFIEIANDPSLAHELAILSSRKAMSDTEPF